MAAAFGEAAEPVADGMPDAPGDQAVWWTQGNALVTPHGFAAGPLPDVAAFTAMIAGFVSP